MSISDHLAKESGSGGQTKVILVNRIYKEAADERMLKLVDEFEFIESIPTEFKDYFPKIILFGTDNNKAFYEMEHYDLPTIRRLMIDDDINEEELLYWADKVTAFSRDLYSKKILEQPKDYFDVMHFNRVSNRMNELERKSEWFKDILNQEYIIINNRKCLNVYLIMELFNNKEFIDTVQPEFVGRWSHSDLHFSNILVDREKDTFILIDPRGYDYCDYYYDYGKFWHSINGKYEMIATKQFDLVDNNFKLHENKIYNLCEQLKKSLPNILYKYSKEEPSDVMRKTEWNEVMHFISLIPFMLDGDGKDERAKVAYYTAIILANDFIEKYHGYY